MPSGTGALANASDGIYMHKGGVFATANIVIGSDTVAADGNTVSGNGGGGIDVDTEVGGNKIYGNYIGTNASGANLGNTSDGVYINGSSTNEIGNGFASGKNTIAFNGG